jgi:hypothetical protein
MPFITLTNNDYQGCHPAGHHLFYARIITLMLKKPEGFRAKAPEVKP